MKPLTLVSLLVLFAALSVDLHAQEVGPERGSLVIVGGGIQDPAIVVQGDQFEVIGVSYVVIYDHQKMIGTDGKFYFLAPGDRFNLATREATRPSRTMEPVERVKERSWTEQ